MDDRRHMTRHEARPKGPAREPLGGRQAGLPWLTGFAGGACLDRSTTGHLHHSPLRRSFVLGLIIYLFVIGIIAGYLARFLVPGRDPMGFWGTVLLGVVGSFVGGFLGYIIFGEDLDQGALQASGIFGSIIGAIISLLIYRAYRMRSGTYPV